MWRGNQNLAQAMAQHRCSKYLRRKGWKDWREEEGRGGGREKRKGGEGMDRKGGNGRKRRGGLISDAIMFPC